MARYKVGERISKPDGIYEVTSVTRDGEIVREQKVSKNWMNEIIKEDTLKKEKHWLEKEFGELDNKQTPERR